LATAGKEVFVYFNNDWEGFAIRDAVALEQLLPSHALQLTPASG
jgi:uncharacterized protein YecE (DUF72 family)